MKIIWNKVTRFSQIVAIVLFLGVFSLGIYLGRVSEKISIIGFPINTAHFVCANDRSITADFYKNFVHIEPSGKDPMYLPQTISASGARFANADESFVFWNKGNTAFVTEGKSDNVTYKDCKI